MCFIGIAKIRPKNKLGQKLLDIWDSNGKRYKVPRFRCNFCGEIKRGESYSIVDGGMSCEQCDKEFNGVLEQ
jgi:formylmethanofuran dehydrogenase subunit E